MPIEKKTDNRGPKLISSQVFLRRQLVANSTPVIGFNYKPTKNELRADPGYWKRTVK